MTSDLVCHLIEDTKVMLALPLFLGELIVLDHIYTTHSEYYYLQDPQRRKDSKT